MATEKNREKLVWNKLNTLGMTPGTAKLWKAFGTAYTPYKAAKAEFEAHVINELRKKGVLDDESTLMFTYRFGPAIAVVNKRKAKEAGSTTGLSV